MKSIWKFKITQPEVEMPMGAKILTVQSQHNVPTIWAIVNTEEDMKKRTFIVVGTGHEIPKGKLNYIGTIQQMTGMLVWHVFEEVK